MTATDREAPRRLRAADVIETLEAALHNVTTRRDAEPYVTVEFTRNAKGETQISTKVSAPGGTTREALEDLTEVVYANARDVYETACNAYPAASGFVRNDGKDGKQMCACEGSFVCSKCSGTPFDPRYLEDAYEPMSDAEFDGLVF